MLKRLLACSVVALCALLLAAAASPATFEGEHSGANYKIIVPDAGWNGTLVVLAHGYRDKADHPGEVDNRSAMDAGFTAIANGLVAQGYAVAATSYRDNGWAVKESIHDLTRLRALFNGIVGQPDTALLAGFSLGSLATAELAEKAGGLFDGYLPACGVLAGAPRAWDMGAAGLLAYKLIFGMPASWGTPADADDDVDFETEVFPTLLTQILGATDYGKWEFIRLIGGGEGTGGAAAARALSVVAVHELLLRHGSTRGSRAPCRWPLRPERHPQLRVDGERAGLPGDAGVQRSSRAGGDERIGAVLRRAVRSQLHVALRDVHRESA